MLRRNRKNSKISCSFFSICSCSFFYQCEQLNTVLYLRDNVFVYVRHHCILWVDNCGFCQQRQHSRWVSSALWMTCSARKTTLLDTYSLLLLQDYLFDQFVKFWSIFLVSTFWLCFVLIHTHIQWWRTITLKVAQSPFWIANMSSKYMFIGPSQHDNIMCYFLITRIFCYADVKNSEASKANGVRQCLYHFFLVYYFHVLYLLPKVTAALIFFFFGRN